MTPEPREGATAEYTPAAGPRRRVRFEPRSDGTHWRIEDVWTGCTWRETGREPVTDLVVDADEVQLP